MRSDPLQPGDPTSFGALQVVGRLGSGGMADTFLATDGQRILVVKTPRAGGDADSGARLAREVEAMRRIDSPLVARVVAEDLGGPRPWFALEHVPGPTLSEQLVQQGPLDPVAVRSLAAGLAECVAAVHEAGVIHRDLKPDNVVLTSAGPRLIDFGTAELDDSTSLTMVGQVVGTLAWMAPEQLAGAEPTPAVDVHAWGLLVTYAATGIPPLARPTAVATMYSALHETPQVPPGLDDALASMVGRALQKQPALRPDIEEIRAVLAATPAQETIALPPVAAAPVAAATVAAPAPSAPGLSAPGPPPARRRGWVGWAVGAGVLVAAVLAVTMLLGSDGATDAPGEPAATVAPVSSATPTTAAPDSGQAPADPGSGAADPQDAPAPQAPGQAPAQPGGQPAQPAAPEQTLPPAGDTGPETPQPAPTDATPGDATPGDTAPPADAPPADAPPADVDPPADTVPPADPAPPPGADAPGAGGPDAPGADAPEAGVQEAVSPAAAGQAVGGAP